MLTEKKLAVRLSYGSGPKGEGPADIYDIKGLRMEAYASLEGRASMGQLQMKIYGLSDSLMNKYSTYGIRSGAVKKNYLSLFAGDDSAGMSEIYRGTVREAFADYNASPDVSFNILVSPGYLEALKPVPAKSYEGGVAPATILKAIADDMGMSLEANGIDGIMLHDHYVYGDALSQAQDVCHAAGLEMIIDRGVLAVWPRDGYRAGTIPLLSPETGMIGYPTFNSKGIVVQSIFRPDLMTYGARVQVQSSLTPACGVWAIFAIRFSLDCQVPNGMWHVELELCRPNNVAFTSPT